ncbi:hypothetical protein [Bradyrhizobium genomosp. I (2014)]|uniref:hypothetical protein n=1 Tax=Bradyrhizobium genomosp. I (2014) TaxID=2683269 RepID=UPI0004B2B0B2|nr:hypothetical protein [Bradyrhizobium sp. CCBAU 43298]
MSKIIEARAVLSASDKTGNVLDKIASKFKSVEKNAKALEGIKPLKFSGDMFEELKRLQLSEKQLQGVRKEFTLFNDALRQQRPKADHYFRALQEWQGKTVDHWRNIKANVDETDKSYKRFFAGAGAAALRWGLIAGGIGSGAYAVNRVGRAAIEANAISQRESARDYLAGMSEADSQRIKEEALRVSGRYRSVDATTMHERLRDTAMSTRSVDKALELSDVIAQGTTVLQSLKGKDQAIEEGRKFFAALDVLGKNIDPKEVKELFGGYIKALGVEGADMNLGEVLTMSKRLKAAGSTISNRFLMTTGAGLTRDMGADRAGNALSMMMQQEVQATKQAKEYGQKVGLRDKTGKFVDRSSMMADPDYWAWKNITAAMKRAKLDPENPQDVNTFLQSAYSNSSARDVVSKLLTQRSQYEAKAGQYEKAPGLEAASQLPGKDPFVAYESVFAQLRNLATQAPVMDSAAKGLDSISGSIANLNNSVAKGEYSGFFKFANDFMSAARPTLSGTVRDIEVIGQGLSKADQILKTAPAWISSTLKSGLSGANNAARTGGGKGFGQWPSSTDAVPFVPWSDNATYSPATGRWIAGNPRTGGNRMLPAPSFPAPGVTDTMTYGTGANQVTAQVTGEVHGTGKFDINVNAGSSLIEVVRRAEAVIALAGQISSNGPGSTGKSSPDAAAPSNPRPDSTWNLAP